MGTYFEVSHMPDGWNMQTVGRFTDKAKAYRFAHLLTLIQRQVDARGARITFVDHYQQSMRASRNLRAVEHNYVVSRNGEIVIEETRMY